ncbi:MAG: anaerobic ribonucleoside-triphosphate reductase [Candidatus Helarchaeota archaeon]
MSDKKNRIINPQKILNAISNDVRAEILKLLSMKNPLSFTEMMEERGLNPSQDAGRFGYHLRELKKSKLIKGGPEVGYQLTDIGEKVVEFLWTLIELKYDENYIPVRTSGYTIEHFDKNKIIQSLIKEAAVPEDLAEEIAVETEERLLKANIKYLTAPLIREAVNFILIEKGYENYRHSLTRLGLPPYDITESLRREKKVNDNFNPETIHKLAGDAVMEQYLLLNILEHEVADGYLSGDFHIPNANYFILRSNSLHHDIRWFLLDGLKYCKNTQDFVINKPKNLANVLNLITHLLNISQIFISGNQVIDSFNIFLLPYLKNINEKKIKDILKSFFIDIANSYSSRGGQLISCCIQNDLKIPKYLSELSAIGEDGKELGVYSDYKDDLIKFLNIYTKILVNRTSKSNNNIRPPQIFKIDKKILDDQNLRPIIDNLLKVVNNGGEINFVNTSPTWQDEYVSYTDTLERIEKRWNKDLEDDYTACGNLDWVILNLPRIAIESNKILPKFFTTLNEKMAKCQKALEQKNAELRKNILDYNNLPFFKYKVNNLNYFNIRNSTLSIGYIGLYECINIFLDKDSDFGDKIKFMEEILNYMNGFVKEKDEQLNLNFNIRQAVEGEWSKNLVKLDKLKFGNEKVFTLENKTPKYYEIDFSLDSFSIDEIIKNEEKLQKLVNGGHQTIIPINDQNEDELFVLLKKISNRNIGYFKFVKNKENNF